MTKTGREQQVDVHQVKAHRTWAYYTPPNGKWNRTTNGREVFLIPIINYFQGPPPRLVISMKYLELLFIIHNYHIIVEYFPIHITQCVVKLHETVIKFMNLDHAKTNPSHVLDEFFSRADKPFSRVDEPLSRTDEP
jgi:hypothetical protein